MEKRFLLLSALALCLSPVMMAQDVDPDKPIWDFNFDDGDMSMFDESDDASIAGAIEGVTYYILPLDQEMDQTLKFGLDTTPKFTVDTTIVIHHNLAPMNDVESEGGRVDEVSIEPSTDEDNDELSKLGVVDPSVNFFRYKTNKATKKYAQWGGVAGQTEDYQANLFVRNLPVEEHTSYRVSYYMRVDTVNAYLDVRLLRGWYDSEKPFAMDGKGSKTFIHEVKGSDWVVQIAEGINDTIKENLNHWRRYTYMTYYSSADTINKFAQNQYYWNGLDSRWNLIFQDARQRGQVPPEIEEKMHKVGDISSWWSSTHYDSIFASRIEQPNTFFLRFAFRAAGTTYDIDNIALYKSTIAYAEYSGNQIRLNLGYDTNMKDVINNNGGSKLGRIDVTDLDLFQLTGDGGEAPEIMSVEFQNDGMIYLWLDGTPEEDVKLHLTFQNSSDPAFQLKYLADKLYPYFDRIGVEDNLVVPGFKNELVLPSGFAPVPGIADVPPVLDAENPASVEPKSFGLDNATQRAFTFNLNKKAYINPDDFDYTIKATIYGGLPGYEIEKDAFTLELLNEESSESVTFVVPGKDDMMKDIVLKGVYTIELYCLHADLEGEPSEFSEADYGDGPIKVEYSWGNPQDIIDVDKRSTAYIYNKKVTDAYNADMAELDKVSDVTSPAIEGLRQFVAQYEPVAFLQNHQAPSQYDAAEKALKDKLTEIQTAVKTIQDYQASVKRAVDAKAGAVGFEQTNKYKDLSEALADTANINPNKSTAEELIAFAKLLHHVTINGESLPWVVAQANALFKLSKDLGNDLSGDTYVTELMNNMENDNPTLNEVLKLNVKKALLNKIKALGEGQTTDSIEVSPLFDNYRFYSTALLGDDKDIKSYNAQYHNNILCYRTGSKADSLRVFPGWKFGSTTSNGNTFGFWPSRGDKDYDNGEFRGDYCESDDEALAGTVACDWGVSFVLMQTMKDLPAGQYTIQAPGHYTDVTQIKNDLLIANQDTAVNTNMDATETAPAIVGIDSMTVTTVLEQPGDIAFKMTHEQMNSGFLMYNMIMYFKGAKDPIFNYDMAIAAIDKQINDIKDEAAAVVAAKKVELYNINGVKISNAEPGQIVIRVTDGIAEKIVAE